MFPNRAQVVINVSTISTTLKPNGNIAPEPGITRGRNLAGAGTKLNQPGPGLTGILKCCQGRGRDWLKYAGAGIFLI